MLHKHALTALDRTHQDSQDEATHMVGIIAVLTDDLRRTLPVIPIGAVAHEFKACLKASHLWRDVFKIGLATVMRVHLEGDVSLDHITQK
jgi:hypothetical protein